MIFISSLSLPQGAFSLVIEAWYSPEVDQPGGEETLPNHPPLEGDIPFETDNLYPVTYKKKKERFFFFFKVTSPRAVGRMWLFPSVLDCAVC